MLLLAKKIVHCRVSRGLKAVKDKVTAKVHLNITSVHETYSLKGIIGLFGLLSLFPNKICNTNVEKHYILLFYSTAQLRGYSSCLGRLRC